MHVFFCGRAHIDANGRTLDENDEIEKELSLAHAVKELQRISVREGLQYKKEEDGIRAIGPLYVLGSYLDMQDRTQTIREMIDMDVFAPAQKLSQEDFVITIGEVIPQARQQQLALSIELQIEGLREETPADVQEETLPPALESAAAVDEEKEAVPAEESDALTLLDDCFDDLFEEEETTYTTCRLVVARPDDTYAAIAQRYAVDEGRLKSCNQDREIIGKTLVILP